MNSTAKIMAIKSKIKKIQEMKRNNSGRLSVTTGTFQSKISDSYSENSRENRFRKVLSSPNSNRQSNLENSFKKMMLNQTNQTNISNATGPNSGELIKSGKKQNSESFQNATSNQSPNQNEKDELL